MFIERINKKIDTSKFDKEFEEKNRQWFYAFDDGADVVLFKDSDNDYYSLLTVVVDGVDNSIPVPVFEEMTDIDAFEVADIVRSKADYYYMKGSQASIDVICEYPLFEMRGNSWNGLGETISITASMLRLAEVGQTWEAHDTHNCGRDVREESLEVVYKTDRGCACLHRVWGTTDSPNPDGWEREPKLIWFELL
jgi:hypothetical protein